MPYLWSSSSYKVDFCYNEGYLGVSGVDFGSGLEWTLSATAALAYNAQVFYLIA